MNKKRVAELTKELIIEMGEDPNREGLLTTPERVAESLAYLTGGYKSDPQNVINKAVYESHANNMIIVRNIEVYSLCEHHMLPFFGKCHVGYIATGKVIGISKIARVVDCFARRLQIQERLTAQIANEINKTLNPEGIGVVMECKHLCMMMRGVEKQNSIMTTSSVLGSFHNEATSRTEFLNLIGNTTA